MAHLKCLCSFFVLLLAIVDAGRFYVSHHEISKRNDGSEMPAQSIINCSHKESISEFPPDIFDQEQRLHGAIIVHLFVGFYCFVLIAFVCNDYFLPSVFCICQDLHLTADIAGATFMATATCAPELFVSVIGTYLTESDLGIGTVVGSGVCNILGVTACAGLAATKDIKLEVWPLLRDSGIYSLVIGLLAAILYDGIIMWYEALILVIIYFLYFIFMFTQKKMKTAAKKVMTFKSSFSSTSSLDPITPGVYGDDCGYGRYRSFYFSDFIPTAEKVANQVENKEQQQSEKCSQSEVTPVCSPPGGILLNTWWLISVPIAALLSVSIPDCRVNRKYYPLTFIMCIVWIGICSYMVSWMMTIFGYTFHINDAIMGITFLAIGGSIPEASSAVVNARSGIGSMTISNALGANTLDILIGLGGPWLLKTLLSPEMGGGPITLETTGLTSNCVSLLVSIIILNLITYANSFNMNRLYGSLCLLGYFILITIIVLTDLNIIFDTGSSSSTCA